MKWNPDKFSGKGRHLLAAALMILSALLFSAMQLMIRFSGASGQFPVMEQAFFRNLISLIGVFFILLRRKTPMLGSRTAQPWLFGRSVAGFLAILTFFYATSHARIADANMINKLSPVVVTILSIFFLREKVGRTQYISLAVTLIGVWLVCGPSFDSAPLAMVMALLSALFSGIAYTFVACLKSRAEPLTVIMHFSAFSVLCAGILMIPDFVMPTLKEFGMLVLIGVFGSFGQITLTYSYKFAPASEVSIYTYSGIVWSALLGQIFLYETSPWTSVLGGILIIGASLAVYLSNRKRAESELPPAQMEVRK